MNDRSKENEALQATSRFQRRGLVTVMYLLLVVAMFLFGFADGYRGWSLASGLLLTSYLIVLKLVLFDMKGLTQDKVKDLDERERGIHGRAYFRAYMVFGVLIGIALSYTGFATSPIRVHDGINLPTPSVPEDLLLLNCFFLHLFFSLPIAMMAWAEPDPPDMDED